METANSYTLSLVVEKGTVGKQRSVGNIFSTQ